MDPTDETQGAPAPAASEPNPWEPWGQVFQDPGSVNPYEVHQHHQWVSDLRGDETHGPTLERALRDWGYLQDGESLSDLQAALEGRRTATNDPIAARLSQLGEEDPNEDLPLDPYAMREIWREDISRERQQLMEEFENRQRSLQLELELQSQLNKVAAEKGLDDDDRQDLWNQVQYRIQTGQVQANALNSLVADTYGAFEARLNKALNARMSAGSVAEPAAPSPGAGGAAPTASAPVRSIRDLARATMERMGQDED